MIAEPLRCFVFIIMERECRCQQWFRFWSSVCSPEAAADVSCTSGQCQRWHRGGPEGSKEGYFWRAKGQARGAAPGIFHPKVCSSQTVVIYIKQYLSLLGKSFIVFLRPCYNADSELRGRGGASGRRAGNARMSDNMNLRGKREFDRHNGTWVCCPSVFVFSSFQVHFNP